jgi:class 3 adenylate cyclase
MAEFAGGPVAILFSDVEGSTDLRTDRGDAAAHRILRSHEEVVRRRVAEHGGKEIKALGDGFMVALLRSAKHWNARWLSSVISRTATSNHPARRFGSASGSTSAR